MLKSLKIYSILSIEHVKKVFKCCFYETKAGEKRYVTEILVNELLLLGGK